MTPLSDKMQLDYTLNWIFGNVATVFLLFMSQGAVTMLGTMISWIGILSLAVFNLVKAYSAWEDMKRKRKENKDESGSSEA